MLKGRIKNINSTKYFVDVQNETYDCTVRGIFRKMKITPLVGDYVEIDEDKKQIVNVLERKNFLRRPNIANVDIALIITSVKKPDLDLVLLDKLIVHVITSKIKPVICFTKVDLLEENEKEAFLDIRKYYSSIGVDVITNEELDKFKKIVSGKVLVCCGQTGAGKSTFINKLEKNLNLATSPISESLGRGVHTTRYVSLYKIDDYYIADTPGFSFLELSNMTKEDVRDAFLEFKKYNCKYSDCMHINTDGCLVIENLDEILCSRYENYKRFIKEQNESSSKLFKK